MSFSRVNLANYRSKPRPSIGWEHVVFETIELDPRSASEFLEANLFEDQRGIKDRRVNELSQKVEEGSFHGGEVAIAHLMFDYEMDGKKVRRVVQNGQHCCSTAIKTGRSLKCVLKEMVVWDEEGLAALWSNFDNGNSRTPQQMANSHRKPWNKLTGQHWNATQINNCASAVSSWICGKGVSPNYAYRGRTTAPSRLRELTADTKYREAAVVAGTIAWTGQSEARLTRTACLASIIGSYLIDADGCREFWELVRDGGRVSPYHPALVLRNKLIQSSTGNTKHGNMSDTECWHWCSFAWNAYKRGVTEDFTWRGSRGVQTMNDPENRLLDAYESYVNWRESQQLETTC